jgi:hypothetical protein
LFSFLSPSPFSNHILFIFQYILNHALHATERY